MAHSAHCHALLVASGLLALSLAPAAQAQLEVEGCSLGSQGADATGNDCGSIERVFVPSKITLASAKPLVQPRPARAPARPQVTPAPSKAPPQRIESPSACAMGASGVDSTGNECNAAASVR